MTVLPLQNYPKQFVIAKTIPPAFDQWVKTPFEDWLVASAVGVPVSSVVSATGKKVGLLIGWVISDGRLLKHGDTVVARIPEAEIAKFPENLCGRFVFLFSNETIVSIAVDAGGLLPVVYHKEIEALASTPTVLSAFGDLVPNSDLQKAYRIPEKKGWYPFGLTPFEQVFRVVPHHHLNLTTWKQKRVWPREDPVICTAAEIPEVVKEIADSAALNVGAIVKAGSGFVHLTAGYDSRMVLAACRSCLDDCLFETVRMPNQSTALDCFVADALAKKFSLNHEFIDFVDPSQDDISGWLDRTSSCVYDAVTQLSTTIKLNNREYHSIAGICGEVVRSYYWSPKGVDEQGIDAPYLLERLKVPGQF